MHAHDGTGNLWNQVQAHTQWKKLFLPNIVTLHHLTRTSSTLQPTRRTSTSTSQVCRIRWWNDHMASTSTTSTSKWSSTTSSIQSFQQRITRCDQSCSEHWTMRDSRRGAKSTMQSMSDVLGRWHRLLHVRTLLARWYNRKQEVYLVRAGSLLYPELLHQEGLATRSQVREERLQRIPHGKSTSKEVSKETIQEHLKK